MLRRLLPVLVLALPLVAVGLVPLGSAHAEGTQEPTAVYMGGESWIVSYGVPDAVTVMVISERGVPDGTVSVEIDGQLIGGGTLTPSAGDITQGEAVVPLPVLEVGEHDVLLTYPGNERFAPSTFTGTIFVRMADSALTLTATPEPAWAGESVTFTATVEVASEGASPSGTVSFHYGSADLAVRPVAPDGTATFTTSDLPAGSSVLSATYSGDDHYRGSSTDGRFYEVRRVTTTTELSISQAPATYGDPVRFVAVVRSDVASRGAPNGSVAFLIDGRPVEVPLVPVGDPSDGISSAVLERADLAVGTHRIGARYNGVAAFSPSTAAHPGDLVITRRITTLTAAPVFLGLDPWLLPKAVLRATLSGNGRPVAGYPVTFTTGKTVLCTATTDSRGVATCDANTQRLALTLNGGYVAAYAGDPNNTASSARGNLIG